MRRCGRSTGLKTGHYTGRDDPALPILVGVLGAAAEGGPVGEGFQVVAILPGKVEEFVGVEVGGFFA